MFDGEPVLAPVAGTPLTVAVNTNWDVFVDGSSKSWYWLNNGAWLRAADVKGAWAPAGSLPAAFSSLPDDRNFADVRKQVPGRGLNAADMPQVFVSTTPAEIIVTQARRRYTAIPGTQLQYVANTDAPRSATRATGDVLPGVGALVLGARPAGAMELRHRSLPADSRASRRPARAASCWPRCRARCRRRRR